VSRTHKLAGLKLRIDYLFRLVEKG